MNSNEGATADQMKTYAASAGIPYAILIDKEGKLQYHGAHDDRKEPEAKGA